MKLGQQLKIKQNQSLIMTPQLQQAIKLLQLTNIELADFIDKAQLENPFLQEKKEFSHNQQINNENLSKILNNAFFTLYKTPPLQFDLRNILFYISFHSFTLEERHDSSLV